MSVGNISGCSSLSVFLLPERRDEKENTRYLKSVFKKVVNNNVCMRTLGKAGTKPLGYIQKRLLLEKLKFRTKNHPQLKNLHDKVKVVLSDVSEKIDTLKNKPELTSKEQKKLYGSVDIQTDYRKHPRKNSFARALHGDEAFFSRHFVFTEVPDNNKKAMAKDFKHAWDFCCNNRFDTENTLRYMREKGFNIDYINQKVYTNLRAYEDGMVEVQNNTNQRDIEEIILSVVDKAMIFSMSIEDSMVEIMSSLPGYQVDFVLRDMIHKEIPFVVTVSETEKLSRPEECKRKDNYYFPLAFKLEKNTVLASSERVRKDYRTCDNYNELNELWCDVMGNVTKERNAYRTMLNKDSHEGVSASEKTAKDTNDYAVLKNKLSLSIDKYNNYIRTYSDYFSFVKVR